MIVPDSILNLCVCTNQGDNMRGRGGGDTIHGRGGDDKALGGDGNDEVSSGLGIDPSVGGAGDDSLSGGDGDDSYFFSADWGADRIPSDGEGAGTDTLDFSLLVDPLDVDLVSSPDRDEVFSDAGMLNFPATVEIENVSGGEARDVVRGNDARNRYSGNGGNDSLVSRGDEDVLFGGLGADALTGGRATTS